LIRPGAGKLAYLAELLYRESCKRDPWPQNDGGDLSFGTDTTSLGTVMVDMGFWKEYRWAFNHQDVRTARGYYGPGIWAAPWFNSMFFPKADGTIEIVEADGTAGWHAFLSTGQSMASRQGRIHNSWGAGWGLGGAGFLSFENEERLMALGASFLIPVGRTSV